MRTKAKDSRPKPKRSGPEFLELRRGLKDALSAIGAYPSPLTAEEMGQLGNLPTLKMIKLVWGELTNAVAALKGCECPRSAKDVQVFNLLMLSSVVNGYDLAAEAPALFTHLFSPGGREYTGLRLWNFVSQATRSGEMGAPVSFGGVFQKAYAGQWRKKGLLAAYINVWGGPSDSLIDTLCDYDEQAKTADPALAWLAEAALIISDYRDQADDLAIEMAEVAFRVKAGANPAPVPAASIAHPAPGPSLDAEFIQTRDRASALVASATLDSWESGGKDVLASVERLGELAQLARKHSRADLLAAINAELYTLRDQLARIIGGGFVVDGAQSVPERVNDDGRPDLEPLRGSAQAATAVGRIAIDGISQIEATWQALTTIPLAQRRSALEALHAAEAQVNATLSTLHDRVQSLLSTVAVPTAVEPPQPQAPVVASDDDTASKTPIDLGGSCEALADAGPEVEDTSGAQEVNVPPAEPLAQGSEVAASLDPGPVHTAPAVARNEAPVAALPDHAEDGGAQLEAVPEVRVTSDVSVVIRRIEALMTGGAPGIGLALARAFELDSGSALPGAPGMYALLAAAEAQTLAIPASNATLDIHLSAALEMLAGNSVRAEHRGYIMAATAAAIRPALFDANRGNSVALMHALGNASGLSATLRSLASLVARPEAKGVVELRPELLSRGFQFSEAKRKTVLEQHARKARDIAAQKDSEFIRNFQSFTFAQRQHEVYIGPDHLIGKALRKLGTAGHGPDVIQAVQRAFDDIPDAVHDYIQEGYKGAHGPGKLLGAHYQRMESFLEAMKGFLGQAREDLTWSPESVAVERAAAFAAELDSLLATAIQEIRAIKTDASGQLCAVVLVRVFEALRALISNGTAPTERRNIDDVLNHELALLDISIGPDLAPSMASGYALGREPRIEDDAGAVIAATQSVPLPLDRSVNACIAAARRHLRARRLLAARRAFRGIDESAAKNAEAGALGAQIEQAIQEGRQELQRDIDRQVAASNQLYVLNLLSDEQRSSFDSLLTKLSLRVKSLPCEAQIDDPGLIEMPCDIDLARRYIEVKVAMPLRALHEQGCADLRERIVSEQSKLAPEIGQDVPRVLQLLDAGKLDVASEYWPILQSGQRLPSVGAEASVLADFNRRFLPAIEAAGQANGVLQEAVSTFTGGGARSWLTESLTEPQRKLAESRLKLWTGLFAKLGGRNSIAAVSEFFETFLGVRGAQIHVSNASGYVLCRVTGIDLAQEARSKGVFAVPALGSQRSQVYEVALVQKRDGTPVLNAAMAHADVVLYHGFAGRQARESMLTHCRETSKGALLVDDALAIYMALDESLARMVAVGSSFLRSIPYGDTKDMPTEMFFGRHHIRQAIMDARAGVLVYGGRRLGKSSVLRDIAAKETHPESGRYYVYLYMPDTTVDDYQAVFWSRVSDAFADGMLPKSTSRVTKPAKQRADIVETIKSRNIQVMLLIDEADDMLRYEADAQPKFPALQDLSSLVTETDGRFRFAVAGLNNTERLARYANSILDQLSAPVALTPFIGDERAAGLQLVMKPMAALGFEFESPDVAYEIVNASMFFPALIQVYCERLLKLLYAQPVQGLPPYKITAQHLSRVDQDGSLSKSLVSIFHKTLELDPRYRVMAFAMALEQMASLRSSVVSMTPAALFESVRSFAPLLFPQGTDPTAVEALADELVNLGVFIRSNEGKEFQLRSVKLLARLGTRDEIEAALVSADKVKLRHDMTERRITYSNGRVCPLPLRAISDLGFGTPDRPPVRVVVYSNATGGADAELMASDRKWLGGRAEPQQIRSIESSPRALVESAVREPTRGRLRPGGPALATSRSVMVVLPGWPVAAMAALKTEATRIRAAERMVALLADASQAMKLCTLVALPVPIAATGLWSSDAVQLFLMDGDPKISLASDQVEALLRTCGRAPGLIVPSINKLAAGSTVESWTDACAAAGVRPTVQSVMDFFGVPPDLGVLITDLACVEFDRARFAATCKGSAAGYVPETLLTILMALGAVTAGLGDRFILNSVLEQAVLA